MTTIRSARHLNLLWHGEEIVYSLWQHRVSRVDDDVEDTHRQEVIEYIRKKYGEVYNIRTFNYLGVKGAIQRACQALRLPPQQGISLSKNAESFEDVTGEIKDIAEHFYGLLSAFGCHASAIMIFPDSPTNYCPIEKQRDTFVASYDYHDLENFGLLKLDLLGLRNLSVIHETLDLIGKDIDITKLPLDDEEVLQQYATGNTTGIFQCESPGMRGFARSMHVSCFADIIALIALYRPGPLDSGMAQQYIDGKNGEEIQWMHPALKDILGDTYGVIVYQEQVMAISRKLAGFSMGEADNLRKVIGRKELTKDEHGKSPVDYAVEGFISAAMKHGVTESVAKELGRQISAAGRYIFNKCLSGREYIFRYTNEHTALNIGEMYKTMHDYKWAKEHGYSHLHQKYMQHGYGQGFSMKDGKIVQNNIVDIRYSGIMPVYLVTTKTGKLLRCTMNHKIPTPKGEKLLSELSIGDDLFIDAGRTKRGDYIATDTIVSIEFEKDEDCYDVEMGQPHNFITGDGIVVCNSHAASYGFTSYITAWLRTHYPLQYLCALLNSTIGDIEKTVDYIKEAKRLNIVISTPNLSECKPRWSIEGNTLVYALTAIKGVGGNLVTSPCASFTEVVSVNNKGIVEALIKAGALDYLGKKRGKLLGSLAAMKNTVSRRKLCEQRVQENSSNLAAAKDTKLIKKYTRQLHDWQKKLSECSIDFTELEGYDEAAGEIAVLGWTDKPVPRMKKGEVTKIYKKNDKNGHEMAWLTLASDYGEFRATVFYRGWSKIKNVVKVGIPVSFIIDDGILTEISIGDNIYRTNERRWA